MRHAKILDCTLRDGAYLINKNFGKKNIKGITASLVNAGIDFVEIGFFQNDGFGEGKTVFLNSKEASQYIPDDKMNTMFTVLADCSRYDINNLDERKTDSVDAVRECFFRKEIDKAIDNCRRIKEKGYLLFVQPVDILGYTDREVLDLIEKVNSIEPYCFSIVDTFGSMYQEDLHRIFELINHNLISTCRIGFHSHNNMQLSSALSQEFLRMSAGKREVIVDSTLSGMGRGAGNTPTELITQYMISKLGYSYDMDIILDAIDTYMDNIRSRCEWGYSTPYFVAGCLSAHVNNIIYLTAKNSIRSKDIRFILNSMDIEKRKRYDYELLERQYMKYTESGIDDSEDFNVLKNDLRDKLVLIIAPGKSVTNERNKIKSFINSQRPIVIAINYIYEDFAIDYLYMSNVKRYNFWKLNEQFPRTKKILTSNIPREHPAENSLVISFQRLVKCGWEHMDNSTILLLRLLDATGAGKIAIAGFDGYDINPEENYAVSEMTVHSPTENYKALNEELSSMLSDFIETRKNKESELQFITTSRFAY